MFTRIVKNIEQERNEKNNIIDKNSIYPLQAEMFYLLHFLVLYFFISDLF